MAQVFLVYFKLSIILFLFFVSYLVFSSCQDSEIRQGYLSPVVYGFEKCEIQTQVCMQGTWTGPNLYSFCENHTKPCGIFAHGMVQKGYLTSHSPCTFTTRTCINGQWTGSATFSLHCN